MTTSKKVGVAVLVILGIMFFIPVWGGSGYSKLMNRLKTKPKQIPGQPSR